MDNKFVDVISGNQNTTLLIAELKNMKKQYPILSKKEEQELILKYKNNRDKLNTLLIMHNCRIVFNLAKKYKNRTLDFDSLVQDGFLGLSEAAERFDINKNIKFSTYAYIWIRKYILQRFYLKNKDIDNNSISLNKLIFNHSLKDDGQTELQDYITQYADLNYVKPENLYNTLSTNEHTELCCNLINDLNNDNTLSATDKKIFISILNGSKLKDLSEIYNIAVKDIKSLQSKILKKFKNILANKYQIKSYCELM